jgi:hypothetical protein
VLSQGDFFRAEATVALIAAATLLFRLRRYTAALAFVVAAAGTGAVVVHTYVNLGGFGPSPDMYDPAWYTQKTLSAVAEGIAAIAALILLGVLHGEARLTCHAPTKSSGRRAVRAHGTVRSRKARPSTMGTRSCLLTADAVVGDECGEDDAAEVGQRVLVVAGRDAAVRGVRRSGRELVRTRPAPAPSRR